MKARAAAEQDWQIRDLRAKAASDLDTTEDAQALLAHSDITTTGITRAGCPARRQSPSCATYPSEELRTRPELCGHGDKRGVSGHYQLNTTNLAER